MAEVDEFNRPQNQNANQAYGALVNFVIDLYQKKDNPATSSTTSANSNLEGSNTNPANDATSPVAVLNDTARWQEFSPENNADGFVIQSDDRSGQYRILNSQREVMANITRGENGSMTLFAGESDQPILNLVMNGNSVEINFPNEDYQQINFADGKFSGLHGMYSIPGAEGEPADRWLVMTQVEGAQESITVNLAQISDTQTTNYQTATGELLDVVLTGVQESLQMLGIDVSDLIQRTRQLAAQREAEHQREADDDEDFDDVDGDDEGTPGFEEDSHTDDHSDHDSVETKGTETDDVEPDGSTTTQPRDMTSPTRGLEPVSFELETPEPPPQSSRGTNDGAALTPQQQLQNLLIESRSDDHTRRTAALEAITSMVRNGSGDMVLNSLIRAYQGSSETRDYAPFVAAVKGDPALSARVQEFFRGEMERHQPAPGADAEASRRHQLAAFGLTELALSGAALDQQSVRALVTAAVEQPNVEGVLTLSGFRSGAEGLNPATRGQFAHEIATQLQNPYLSGSAYTNLLQGLGTFSDAVTADDARRVLARPLPGPDTLNGERRGTATEAYSNLLETWATGSNVDLNREAFRHLGSAGWGNVSAEGRAAVVDRAIELAGSDNEATRTSAQQALARAVEGQGDAAILALLRRENLPQPAREAILNGLARSGSTIADVNLIREVATVAGNSQLPQPMRDTAMRVLLQSVETSEIRNNGAARQEAAQSLNRLLTGEDGAVDAPRLQRLVDQSLQQSRTPEQDDSTRQALRQLGELVPGLNPAITTALERAGAPRTPDLGISAEAAGVLSDNAEDRNESIAELRRRADNGQAREVLSALATNYQAHDSQEVLNLMLSIAQAHRDQAGIVVELLTTQLRDNTPGAEEQTPEQQQRFSRSISGLQQIAAAGLPLGRPAVTALVQAAAVSDTAARQLEEGFRGDRVSPELGQALVREVATQLQNPELPHDQRLRLLSSVNGLSRFIQAGDVNGIMGAGLVGFRGANSTQEQQEISARLGTLVQNLSTTGGDNVRSSIFQFLSSNSEGWNIIPAAARQAVTERALTMSTSDNPHQRNSALQSLSRLASSGTEGAELLGRDNLPVPARNALIEGLSSNPTALNNVDLIRRIGAVAADQTQPPEIRQSSLNVLLQAVNGDSPASQAAIRALRENVNAPEAMQALVSSALNPSRPAALTEAALTSLRQLASAEATLAPMILESLGSAAETRRQGQQDSGPSVQQIHRTMSEIPGGMTALHGLARNQLLEDGDQRRPALEALFTIAGGSSENRQAAFDSLRQLAQEPGHEHDVWNTMLAMLPGDQSLLPVAAQLLTNSDTAPADGRAAIEAIRNLARTNDPRAIELLTVQARQSGEMGQQALRALIDVAGAGGNAEAQQAARQAILAQARDLPLGVSNSVLEAYRTDASLLPLLTALTTGSDSVAGAGADNIGRLRDAAASGSTQALDVLAATFRSGNPSAQAALDAIATTAFAPGTQSAAARNLLLQLNAEGSEAQRNAVWQSLLQRLENDTRNNRDSSDVLRVMDAALRRATTVDAGDGFQTLNQAARGGSQQAIDALSTIVRAGGDGSHRAISALVAISGDSTAAGAAAARTTLRTLVREAANQTTGLDSQGRRTWLDQYVASISRGSRADQTNLLNLANVPGLRDDVLRTAMRSYNSDSNLLPVLTAIALERRELPPQPSTAEGRTQEWRSNLNDLNSELGRRFSAGTLDGRTNAVIDLITITAAGPGDRASHAAHLLDRYTRDQGNPVNPDWRRSQALTALFGRGSEVLRAGTLNQQQSDYLLNVMFRQLIAIDPVQAGHIEGHNRSQWVSALRSAPYEHRPIRHSDNTVQNPRWGSIPIANGNDTAAMLAIMNSTGPSTVAMSAMFMPVLQQLGLGGHGDIARREAIRQLDWHGFTRRYDPASGVPELLLGLRSTQTSQVEQSSSAASLRRIVDFANTNAGRRGEIVGYLLDAQSNTELTPAARDRLVQAVGAIAQNDQSVLNVLAQRAPQNDGAFNALLMVAVGGGSAAQAANTRLLEVSSANPALRTRAINELTSIYSSNVGALPTIVALMRNSTEAPANWNAALTGLSQLAEQGDRRAMSMLGATASGAGATPEQARQALTEMARIAGVTLALDPPATGDRAAANGGRATANGMDAFIRLTQLIGERAVETGNRRSVEVLGSMVTDANVPSTVRMLAFNQLQRVANADGHPAGSEGTVASGRAALVTDVMLSTWQSGHSPLAFEALGRLSSMGPPRPEIQQALRDGFQELSTRTPGMSDAELSLRRQAAQAGILADVRNLTPETMRMLAGNMTPELARTLQNSEHIPEATARQFLDIIRETAQNPATGADLGALAQAMTSFATIATPQDVQAVVQLRQRASGDQLVEVNRALLSLTTLSSSRETRRAAYEAFRGSPQWTALTPAMQQSVTNFAILGSANLTNLRQAIDSVQGASPRYPLAVMMQLSGVNPNDYASYQSWNQWRSTLGDPRNGGPRGLLTQSGIIDNPTRHAANNISQSDWAISQLADRIIGQTALGSERTINGWALPILTAARVQPGMPRTSDPSSWVTDVARRLGDGVLPENMHYLVNWQQNLNDSTTELLLRRQSLQEQINDVRRQMAATPGAVQNMYQSLQDAQQAYQQSFQSWQRTHEHIGLPGPAPESPSNTSFQQDERTALNSYQAMQRRLIELNRQLATTDANLSWNQRNNMQAQFFTAVQNGQQGEAQSIALNLYGQYRLPEAMQAEFARQWENLRARGIAPIDRLPELQIMSGSLGRVPSPTHAYDALRQLAMRPDIATLSPEDQRAHREAIDAVANRSAYVIANQTGLNRLAELSQGFEGRVQNLTAFFQIANARGEERERLVALMRTDGQALEQFLGSREVRDTVASSRQTIAEMRRELATMPPGSVGHARLNEMITTFSAAADLLDINGPLGTNIRRMNEYIRDGRLDDPGFLGTVATVATHVVVATAVFAAASAVCVGTFGAATPFVAGAIAAAGSTFLFRPLTQEALFNLHLSNQSSPVMDYLNGRQIYDPSTGRFSSVSGEQVVSGLAREFTSELLSNMITGGVGAGFGRLGQAALSRGLVTPRFAGMPPTTFLGRFGHDMLHGLPIGLGMASVEQAISHAPGQPGHNPGVLDFAQSPMFWAGLLLSSHQGFQGGRTIHMPSAGRLSLTPEMTRQLETALPESRDLTRVRDSLRYLPAEQQRQSAQMILDMVPETRTRLLSTLGQPGRPGGLSLQESAQFLSNLQGLGRANAQQMIDWVGSVPEANNQRRDVARAIAGVERADMTMQLFEVLRTTPENARPGLLNQIAALPPEALGAALLVSGSSRSRGLIETLSSGLNTPEARTGLQTALRDLPHQMRAQFLESIATVRDPAARTALLNDIARHPRGAATVDAIARITEPSRRTALLEGLNTLTRENRNNFFDLIGQTGDPIARTALLRDIAAMTTGQQNVLELLATAPGAQARPFAEALMGIRPNQRPAVLETLGALTDPAQRLAFLESLGSVGNQSRQQLGAFAQMSPADRIMFAENVARLTPAERTDAWTLASRLNGQQLRTAFDTVNGITDAAARTQALRVLSTAGMAEQRSLMSSLSQVPVEHRAATLQAITSLPSGEAAQSLINALHAVPEAQRVAMLDRFRTMAPSERQTVSQAVHDSAAPNTTRAEMLRVLLTAEGTAQAGFLAAVGGLDVQSRRAVYDSLAGITNETAHRNAVSAIAALSPEQMRTFMSTPGATTELAQILNLHAERRVGQNMVSEYLRSDPARRTAMRNLFAGDINAESIQNLRPAGSEPLNSRLASDLASFLQQRRNSPNGPDALHIVEAAAAGAPVNTRRLNGLSGEDLAAVSGSLRQWQSFGEHLTNGTTPAGMTREQLTSLRQSFEHFLGTEPRNVPRGDNAGEVYAARLRNINTIATNLNSSNATPAYRAAVVDILASARTLPEAFPVALRAIAETPVTAESTAALSRYRDMLNQVASHLPTQSANQIPLFADRTASMFMRALESNPAGLEGWAFVPTAPPQPGTMPFADFLGMDGAFINLRTGELRPVNFNDAHARERFNHPQQRWLVSSDPRLTSGVPHENVSDYMREFLQRTNAQGFSADFINRVGMPSFAPEPLGPQAIPQRQAQLDQFVRNIHEEMNRMQREDGRIPGNVSHLAENARRVQGILSALTALNTRAVENLTGQNLTAPPTRTQSTPQLQQFELAEPIVSSFVTTDHRGNQRVVSGWMENIRVNANGTVEGMGGVRDLEGNPVRDPRVWRMGTATELLQTALTTEQGRGTPNAAIVTQLQADIALLNANGGRIDFGNPQHQAIVDRLVGMRRPDGGAGQVQRQGGPSGPSGPSGAAPEGGPGGPKGAKGPLGPKNPQLEQPVGPTGTKTATDGPGGPKASAEHHSMVSAPPLGSIAQPSEGQTVTIGRLGELSAQLENFDGVSRRHIQVANDNGALVVTDLSTLGSFVRGQDGTVTRMNDSHVLRAGEQILLGGEFGPRIVNNNGRLELLPPLPRPVVQAARVPVLGSISAPQPGHELTVGRRNGLRNELRTFDAVSRNHVNISRNAAGEIIVSDSASTSGTFISRRDGTVSRITGNHTLQAGEEILLGRNGPRLVRNGNNFDLLPPTAIREISNIDFGQFREVLRLPNNPSLTENAIAQANAYQRNHEHTGPLEPGFHNAGTRVRFNENGEMIGPNGHPTSPNRPATVFDPPNDPVLRAVLAEASSRFNHLRNDPAALMRALTVYSRELLSPPDLSGRALDNWYTDFNNQHAGERILLGEFIRQGRGVCSQQALLLTALAQNMGLNPTMVRGMNGTHAWVEMNVNGTPHLFDPRGQVLGTPINPLLRLRYTRGVN